MTIWYCITNYCIFPWEEYFSHSEHSLAACGLHTALNSIFFETEGKDIIRPQPIKFSSDKTQTQKFHSYTQSLRGHWIRESRMIDKPKYRKFIVRFLLLKILEATQTNAHQYDYQLMEHKLENAIDMSV